jgi:hypothetical protein
VSLFVLSRTTGRSTKRASTLNDIHILFYLQADHKKKSNMTSLIYFSFPAVKNNSDYCF